MNHLTSKIKTFFATLVLTLLAVAQVQAQVHNKRSGVSMTSNTGGFYEYLPQGYSPSGSTLYPLLIMIHGMGEYGDGSSTQLGRVAGHGVPREIKYGNFPVSFTVGGKVFKFIVLTPQWKVQASSANVNGVIDYALKNYKVDPTRIYLTGLSAGGGVIEAAAADATVGKRIAAIVEFCGTGTPSMTKATSIVNNGVAFWGLHNKYDDVVASSKTINWVANILAVKPTAPAKKTIPNGTSHNVWQSRYPATWKEDGMNIYEWMLQYKRSTTTNQAPVANAGSDKTITLPTSSVALSGSATDGDGTISSYKWTQVSGPATAVFSSTTVANPTVTALVAGTYTFRLTVTDSKGATDYDDVKMVVNAAILTTYTIPGRVEAENYASMSGVQTEDCDDVNGGLNVGYIDLNNWMEYSVKTSAAGTFSTTFRVACGATTGSQFQVQNSAGTALATVTVPYTGGWQTWKNVTVSVKLVSGTQTLRLVSTNSARWNINYIDFAASGTNTNTTPSTKVEAEDFSSMSGVETETTSDAGGGENVRAIDTDDWMKYSISASSAGTYTFTFRLATIYSNAKFAVKNATGTTLATVTVPNTGSGQGWQNVTASVTLPAGTQTLTLYSTGTERWNINYFTYATSTNAAITLASDKAVTEESATAATGLAITPNPFADRFVLTVNNTYTGTMKVQLVDVSGVVRKQFQVAKNAVGTVQTYLSAGTLPAGNYFVKVQMENWSQTKQVVKL